MLPIYLACTGMVIFGTTLAEDPKKPERPRSYVEFDFSTLPFSGDGKYSITITVHTSDKDITWSQPAGHHRRSKPEDFCETYQVFMDLNRWEAEVVDKTKLRVYGRRFNDKVIPAIEGKVTSPDLTKEHLPKVKNPPKA